MRNPLLVLCWVLGLIGFFTLSFGALASMSPPWVSPETEDKLRIWGGILVVFLVPALALFWLSKDQDRH
jgi:hypothetical protein